MRGDHLPGPSGTDDTFEPKFRTKADANLAAKINFLQSESMPLENLENTAVTQVLLWKTNFLPVYVSVKNDLEQWHDFLTWMELVLLK